MCLHLPTSEMFISSSFTADSDTNDWSLPGSGTKFMMFAVIVFYFVHVPND